MATNKPRIMVTMSEDIRLYIERRAEEMGVSMSAVVNMIISEHMKQEKVINSLDDIMKLYKETTGGDLKLNPGQLTEE